MPRLNQQVPKYRRHRASGQAIVTLSGKDHYLGPHGSRASIAEYDRLIGEWLANNRQPQAPQTNSLTIVELVAAYWKWAKGYYRKDGSPTTTLIRVRVALRLLRQTYGSTAAASFGPLGLKSIQQRLITTGNCRRYINHLIQQIKRIFKWAVSQELVPPTVYQALATVDGLKRGRSDAKESQPVLPVSESDIEKTLPHLPPAVADMVRVQRLTGCRPGEICALRPCDVEDRGDHWVYRPASHKTEHHGGERSIVIGPRAQRILRTYLNRTSCSYCFSPHDSELLRREALHAKRRTPLSYGNRPGTNRKPKRKRSPGDRYTSSSYMRAVIRACEVAFGMPDELRTIRRNLPAEESSKLRSAAATWRAEHCWSPNQLRHSAATEIRRKFGLEAAQVTLGHATANITQIYAERDLSLAEQVMRELG